MKNYLIIVVTIIISNSALIQSQPNREENGIHVGSLEYSITSPDSSLDSTIIELMEAYHIPGLTASIVRDGEITWKGAYGYANFEQNQMAKDSTLFMLASVSKTVVAVAALQLWEQGLLEMDDPINKHLPFPITNPNFPNDTITIHMLLTHTSSLLDNWAVLNSLIVQGDSPIPLGVFLYEYFTPGGAYYNQYQNFNTVPGGTYYYYSNVATCVAAYLVEEISNIPFDQYCDSLIFEPLNMMETSWFLTNMDTSHIAMPYSWNGAQYIPYGHYGFPDYPDGQLRSSTIELSQFLLAIMQMGELNSNRILDSATVAFMLTPQIPSIDSTVGILWGSFFSRGREYWGHGGAFDGCRTGLFFCPSHDWGTIILINGEPPLDILLYIGALLWDYDHLPGVTVVTPNGGEAWVMNETVDITWTSESVDDVKIELSIDSGTSWTTIVDSTPSSGTYSWIVNAATPSAECLMRINDISDSTLYDESDSVFAIDILPLVENNLDENIPTEYEVTQNFPNPFNPVTTIKYQIPELSFVTLKVYDVLGNEVGTLVNEEKPIGNYEVEFDGVDLPSGVYFYRLQAGDFVETKKMILLK
jgi:CubicO group peptidase (beta-lactamase class C family)